MNWSPLQTFIEKYDRFLLMTHVRPDADALGSQQAFAGILRTLGKSVRVFIASNLYPRYQFFDRPHSPIERFNVEDPTLKDIQAIVILDTGTYNQLGDFGDFLKNSDLPRAVIDHHRTQDGFGGVLMQDTNSEAAGRMVYDFAQHLKIQPTVEIASDLFAAIATDTGWFRHSSTKVSTYEAAAHLVKCGANPTKLYQLLYENNSFGRFRLTGVALSRISMEFAGKVASTEIYLNDYMECQATPADTEDLINYPRSIMGVELAMIFIEQPTGGTKVSFRSSESVDVSLLAERFSGGGHRMAAGAMIHTDLPHAKQLVMKAVEELLPKI
ncbi:MAG: bifunctional oligoribonuclease/PAP phosphatase NrnA [Zavarzinella sp.]